MSYAFSSALPSPFFAQVRSVADGDTFTVMENDRPTTIRLYAVDSPELSQPFGFESTIFLRTLIAGRMVKIVPHDRDGYGRLVCDTYTPIGQRVSAFSVAAGLSWWYAFYAPNDEQLERLQAEAKLAQRGLWSAPDPIPPWVWRCHRVSYFLHDDDPVQRPLPSRRFHRLGCNKVYSPYEQNTKASETESGFCPCPLCRP